MVKEWMVFGRPPLIFNDVVKYLNISKYNTTYCSSNTEVLREYSFGKMLNRVIHLEMKEIRCGGVVSGR